MSRDSTDLRGYLRRSASTLIGAAILGIAAVGCGGDSNSSTPTTEPTQLAATPTLAPTAAPTAAPTRPAATATPPPATFDPARLQPALMSRDQVTSLLPGAFQALRELVTDPQLPFSSAPEIGAKLADLDVSLYYNSYQVTAAPPPGRPFAFQNTVHGYPSEANAMEAYAALRDKWQSPGFFQNTTQLADLGTAWADSFCQTGDFVSASGQTSQWYVCMAQSGPYVVTVSVGGFSLDTDIIAPVIRAYFDEAQGVIE